MLQAGIALVERLRSGGYPAPRYLLAGSFERSGDGGADLGGRPPARGPERGDGRPPHRARLRPRRGGGAGERRVRGMAHGLAPRGLRRVLHPRASPHLQRGDAGAARSHPRHRRAHGRWHRALDRRCAPRLPPPKRALAGRRGGRRHRLGGRGRRRPGVRPRHAGLRPQRRARGRRRPASCRGAAAQRSSLPGCRSRRTPPTWPCARSTGRFATARRRTSSTGSGSAAPRSTGSRAYDRLRARRRVRRLHHAREPGRREGRRARDAGRPDRARPRHLPGPPLPGAVPRRLDAALVRRRPDHPRAPERQRPQPAPAQPGGRRPRGREPRHRERRAGRARHRRRSVLGRHRGDGRPAPDPRPERHRARGGDRRHPGALGRRPTGRRRTSRAPTTASTAPPAARRRCTTSASGSAPTSRACSS